MLATILDYILWVTLAITGAIVAYKTITFAAHKQLNISLPAENVKSLWEKGISDRTKLRNEADRTAMDLEWGMTLLATVASCAAFLGLAGTVVHIMAALSLMSGTQGDVQVIAGPIATSLKATLIGLASAVPASIAYNFFARTINVWHVKGLTLADELAGTVAPAKIDEAIQEESHLGLPPLMHENATVGGQVSGASDVMG